MPAPPSSGFLFPSQGSLAKPSMPEAPRGHGDGESTRAGWMSRRQSKVQEQKQEKVGKKDDNHSKEVWRKRGAVSQGCPKAYSCPRTMLA